MSAMKITIRDICWMLLVVGCLASWYREFRLRQNAEAEKLEIAKVRDVWKSHATHAKNAFATQTDLRLIFFNDRSVVTHKKDLDPRSLTGRMNWDNEMKTD
jgi:hypothetical protein